MNVANNINGLSYGPSRSRRRRPISVMQLSMTLVFIALPATVLFPIIAEPVQDKPAVVSGLDPYSFNQRVEMTTQYTANVNRLMRRNAQTAWLAFRRYSHFKGTQLASERTVYLKQ